MKNDHWDATQYVEHASFVAKLGSPVLSLLDPVAGESILDLGCGDGTLTLKLSEMGVDVVGVDFSKSMVDAAKASGLSAEVCSGDKLAYDQVFDAVFSNAALHWMTDYQAVIAGVHHSLKAGGRFVAEMGGAGNIAGLLDAMKKVFDSDTSLGEFVNPWFFPDAALYKDALETGGFDVEYIELISRPTPLSSGVIQWLKTFANAICKNLDDRQKDRFYNDVSRMLKPVYYTDENGWVADYVRLRFKARKKS